jgi:hypothetical protein
MGSARRGIVFFALFALASAALAEELYRWVDADGKVHFGDRPPLAAKAENIEGAMRPINTADGGSTQASTAANSNVNTQRQLQREYENRQQQRQQKQQQQMAAACFEARKQLRILQGPVYFVDGQGREVQITERERQQQAEQLQQEIARVCG